MFFNKPPRRLQDAQSAPSHAQDASQTAAQASTMEHGAILTNFASIHFSPSLHPAPFPLANFESECNFSIPSHAPFPLADAKILKNYF